MLPLNHDALRSTLTGHFNALSNGTTGAAQISRVLEELSKATKSILSELASEWNCAHDPLRHMPVEVLAMCFTSLNLRDAMTVSHVSRHWRAVALSHPVLWARIDLTRASGDITAFLEMMLSRTAQYPTDFRGPSRLWLRAVRDMSVVRPLMSSLAQHMSHLRTIVWDTKELDLPFSQPAPLLEHIRGPKCALVIPPDFLGGRAGNLKTLAASTVSFPTTCPALSTLSHLFIELRGAGARVTGHVTTFNRIFELCPQLQSLSLRNIMLEDANSLPTTPAPRTLHKLELETQDPHYDLIGHFVDWKSGDNLTDVALEVDESTLLDCRLHNLVAGATSLFILRGSDGDISIVASGSGESKRAIAFHHRDGEPDENYVRVGALLLKAQSGLRHVESLGIPLGAASDFVSERVFGQALPKLALLNISIEEISELRFNHGWDSLVALLHSVADACPRLESIGVDLQRWLNHPVTADIAHELLAAFEHSMLTLPDISILGFEADTVRDVRIPDMEGCRIRFGGLGDDTVTGRLADRAV